MNRGNVCYIPFLCLSDACKLYCKLNAWSYTPKGLVKDGTRCANGATKRLDICIGGKCNVRSFL